MEKAEIKFNFGSLMKDIDKRSRDGLEIKFLINSAAWNCGGEKVKRGKNTTMHSNRYFSFSGSVSRVMRKWHSVSWCNIYLKSSYDDTAERIS